MNRNLVEIAFRIIFENKYLSLSTCNNDTPWIAPLFYAVDSDFNFYFISAKKSDHARQIVENPQVALAIFNSKLPSKLVNGVQANGVARQVLKSEIHKALDLYYLKRYPNPTERILHPHFGPEYFGISPFRMFKIEIKTLYILDPRILKFDLRVKIDVQDLCVEMKKRKHSVR